MELEIDQLIVETVPGVPAIKGKAAVPKTGGKAAIPATKGKAAIPATAKASVTFVADKKDGPKDELSATFLGNDAAELLKWQGRIIDAAQKQQMAIGILGAAGRNDLECVAIKFRRRD